MKRLALVFSMLIAAASLFAQSDLQVLAVVKLGKSESITLKQLKTKVEFYQKQSATPLGLEQKKQILEALIDEKLVVQAATKEGMTLPDSKVDEYFLQSLSLQAGGAKLTEAEINKMVKEQTGGRSLDEVMQAQMGMNVKDFKASLKNQLISQQYIMQKKKADIATALPSDSEIRAYYELNKANFVQSDALKIFLCVVPKGDNPSAAEKLAKSLYDDYKSKKVSSEQMSSNSHKEKSQYMARTLWVSKTENHAQRLGFTYAQLLELFSKPMNVVSDFTSTSTDYQFYSVLAKTDAKMLGISDVIQPESTVTVYEYIKNILTQQKQVVALSKASQELIAELNKPEYVERKKTGADLDKLLNW